MTTTREEGEEGTIWDIVVICEDHILTYHKDDDEEDNDKGGGGG